MTSSSNKNSNTIVAAGTYHSDKFEYVNQKLREHFQRSQDEIEKVKEKVNELVVIVHNDNKDWSIKKISEYIAGRNDDLEEYGFSTSTIYRYLNQENRKLIDKRKSHSGKSGRKSTKTSSSSKQPSNFDFTRNQKVPEQSSTTTTATKTTNQTVPNVNKAKTMTEAVDEIYEIENNNEKVIYDDPVRQLQELQSEYKNLLIENESLLEENRLLQEENSRLKKELLELRNGAK